MKPKTKDEIAMDEAMKVFMASKGTMSAAAFHMMVARGMVSQETREAWDKEDTEMSALTISTIVGQL